MSTRYRTRYYRLKSEGLCTLCGKNKPEPNHVTCKSCSEELREQHKFIYKKLKANGICTNCHMRKVDKDHTTCRKCRIKRENERSEKRERIRKAFGDKKTFGENLQEVLHENKVSHHWLSTQTGIHKSSISWYVNDAVLPDAEKLGKIAEALGVSVDRLTSGVEIMDICKKKHASGGDIKS